jgi:hypothetical protein
MSVAELHAGRREHLNRPYPGGESWQQAISPRGRGHPPSSPAVAHRPGFQVEVANRNSLDTEGNPMAVAACGGSAGQAWSAYSDHTLRTEGGCLDVVGAGTANSTDVDWYPCNGTAAQAWTHKSDGELVNPKSGRCLTDPGGRTTARLDIETCTGAAAQRWTGPRA